MPHPAAHTRSHTGGRPKAQVLKDPAHRGGDELLGEDTHAGWLSVRRCLNGRRRPRAEPAGREAPSPPPVARAPATLEHLPHGAPLFGIRAWP